MTPQIAARRLGTTTVLALALASALVAQTTDAYRAGEEAWRKDREARLLADESWLTVAGLFWLNEGENSFGADPLNDIVLPDGPPRAGVFAFRNGRTTVRVAKGAGVLMNGKAIDTAEMRADIPGPADTITLGNLTMLVHMSGARAAIRLRDKNSRIRKEFAGLRWFPVKAAYRVEGRFVSYPQPKTVQVPNILGDYETYRSPGTVASELNGQPLRMEPVLAGGNPPRLWFIMRDLTSGKETYHAARFLYADMPGPDGKVVLDFNRAYNPPCAFNPFTTCPLPPPENRLRVRIEAGEMDYHGKKDTSDQ